MNFSSIKNILNQDSLEIIIKRLTAIMRIVLVISITLSSLGLIIIIITGGQLDWGSETFADGFAIISVLAAFYSIIYGTIPAMFLLISISLDNKFRKKTTSQPIKTESRLLLYNLLIILIAAAIMTIKYYQIADT